MARLEDLVQSSNARQTDFYRFGLERRHRGENAHRQESIIKEKRQQRRLTRMISIDTGLPNTPAWYVEPGWE